MNWPNLIFKLLLIGLLCSACTDSDEPNTTYDQTGLPFTIQRVGLGSTEQELVQNLGEPISQTQQPPQFGEREIAYDYQGLYVHVTDGLVNGFQLSDGPLQYDNGIAIDMTRAEVARILGKSYELEQIHLRLGTSDCHAILSFSKNRLRKVFQTCVG